MNLMLTIMFFYYKYYDSYTYKKKKAFQHTTKGQTKIN